MSALAIAAVLVAAGDAGLALVCWRTRTALGGIAAVASAVLVGLSAGSGWTGSGAGDEVLGALAFLIVGAIVFGIGQAIDQLLHGPSDGDSPDAAP